MPRFLILLLLAAGCARESPREAATANLGVPAWAGDAIWYQIFVERFRNGDSSNDPTAHDIERSDRPAPARRLAADAVVAGLVSAGAVGQGDREGLLLDRTVPPLWWRPAGRH